MVWVIEKEQIKTENLFLKMHGRTELHFLLHQALKLVQFKISILDLKPEIDSDDNNAHLGRHT